MRQPPEFRGNFHRDLRERNTWGRIRSEEILDPALPIIDSHHHLWDEEHRGRYLLDNLVEDITTGHNIVATVYIEAGSMYRADVDAAMQPVGEVEFANGAAAMSASGRYAKSRCCAAIVGYADLMLGDKLTPVLEALVAAGNGRFRGVRYSVPWDSGKAAAFYRRKIPRYQLFDPVFRRGYARLLPLDLSFDAWLLYPQMSDLADLLRAFPDTRVILNHVGGPLGIPPHDVNRDEVFKIWRGHIRNLAQFQNLDVKLGGLGMMHCGWDFHLHDVPPSSQELAAAWRPYIEACIEAFGVHRCMMESNFPVDKQSCSYGTLWNAMKRITMGCSDTEKLALYRDTAARVYHVAI